MKASKLQPGIERALLLAVACCTIAAGLAGSVTWADGPRDALATPAIEVAPGEISGDDLPPVGRSLFDYLVTRELGSQRRYDVPFPFSALVRQIASRDSATDAGVRGVLIPLGRSLQRAVAAPEFFRYPRAVVAFDGDGAEVGGVLLKDRIYLGYQEAAEVVEVISYNERAGRFEFQVVRDYRDGATPSVRYANRALCRACHQNDAPLFARRLWSETNANPQVAALLARHGPTFYGIPVSGGVDISEAIDDATDRANLFSVWQALWQDGCQVPGDEVQSRRCRADALTLAVAHRLGAAAPLEPESKRLSAALDNAWSRRWPRGLTIPNADIPNRDPLLEIDRRSGSLPVSDDPQDELARFIEALIRSNSIPSSLEPLKPRAPAAVWAVDEPQRDARFVAGLARFLATADVTEIDRLLARSRAKNRPVRTETHAPCAISRVERSDSEHRISFDCGARQPGGEAVPQLTGRLYFSASGFMRGSIERIRIFDQSLIDVELHSKADEPSGGEPALMLSARQRALGLSAMLPDGRVLETVTLRWPAPSRTPGIARGTVTLTLTDGLVDLRDAIDALLASSDPGQGGALAAGPFRRALVVEALLRSLGTPSREWCCQDTSRMPSALLDEPPSAATEVPVQGIYRTFVESCGQCHRSPHTSPPNFLAGGEAQIDAQVRHCAERIHYRLQMWHRDTQAQTKTPMPPVSALEARSITPQQWRASGSLVALSAHVRTLLEREPGAGFDRPESVLGEDYASLRSCLPEKAMAQSAPPAGNKANTATR